MHIKRRFFAVAVIALIVVGAIFAGKMGIQNPEEEIDITSLFNKKETIYFWYADDSMTSYINSAAVAFGEKEDVRVIPIMASDSNYLGELNNASLHSEQIPDAFIISNDALEKAYLAGLTEEIKDVKGVCNEQNFLKTALDSVTYKGKKVAYPLSYDTSVLLYNETYLYEWATQQAHKALANAEDGAAAEGTDEGAVLDEALVAEKTAEYFAKAIPTTVEDLLTIADSFDVPEGVEGVMKWDVSDIFHNFWIVGNYLVIGSDTGDDESSIQIVSDQTVACLKVYQALNQFFSIESDTVTYESVMDDFVNGRIVFTIGGTDAIRRVEQAKADGVFTHDYGVAVMPNINKMLASRSLSVTNVVAVNSYSEHKELANKFAAFLVDEYAGELYERTGKVASNVKINQDNGALQICMLEYANSISLPKMMEIGNLWLQLEALFAKVWNGEVVTPLLEELSEQISTQIIQ